ncbi:MAG: hypothetical protein EZS28_001061 [Streblomastix strix]|uniref:RNase H type-1 domain-containing protein n=1 Tax=Streblomastix strix TaxID=222440 RepID=A0A5J4X8D2_9EUKA|nr:MAG: hypothetical protein EZS28_001061 [Streblomastix strix]
MREQQAGQAKWLQQRSAQQNCTVDDSAEEQQTKNDRLMIKADNNIDGRVNFEIESMCDQRQFSNQKNIWRMGTRYREFGLVRDTGDIWSKTDNTTVCFSIAKAKAKYHLRNAIDSILQTEVENAWILTIRYIAGKLNKEADALSRLSMAEDYSIRKEILEEVLKDWQVKITVDLSAARNNAKHKRYYILRKDKKVDGGDAMRIPCEQEFALIHPLKPIISRIVRKIIDERVQGVMIVPSWLWKVWQIQLKEITDRERELGESVKVLEMGSKMKKKNLKVHPGRILDLEVNWDKMEARLFGNALGTSRLSGNAIRTIMDNQHGS